MNGYTDSMQSLFDEEWYCANHRDVSGEPLDFFSSTGWRRGDNPSPLFSTSWYMIAYPDVARSGIAPLEHFASTGQAEGRSPHPLFDPTFYAAQANVAHSVGLWNDFCTRGGLAGFSPHPLFNARWYLDTYTDVQESQTNPLIHYLLHGMAENRQASPIFDNEWYAQQYPVAARTFGGPLVDFVTYGASVGRDPSPHFSVETYRRMYMLAEEAGQNPLVHYIGNVDNVDPLRIRSRAAAL